MLLSNLLLASCLFLLSSAAPRPHRYRGRSAHRRTFGHSSGGDSHNSTGTIQKRAFDNARATFYDVGLGACGWYNTASDYIVAQNSPQYGGGYPGPNCGKSITISYNGIQVQATIADECPTCPYGGLDMSRGLFDRFASEDVGQFYMTWWYNDGSDGGGPQQPSPSPEAPSSAAPPPTTTQSPSPTPTPSSSTSTQAQTTSSSSSSTITSAASSSASSSVGVKTNGTVLPDIATVGANTTVAVGSTDGNGGFEAGVSTGNLLVINQVVARLGHIIVVGAGGS